jgi:hypothetical protein
MGQPRMSRGLAGSRTWRCKCRLKVEYLNDRCLLSGYTYEPIAFLGESVLDTEFSNYFQIGGINNRADVAFVTDLPRPEDGADRDAAVLERDGRFSVLGLTGETDPAGGIFGSAVLAPLSINDRGDAVVAFDLDPFAFPVEPNAGLYRYTAGKQETTAIVLPGMPAPGGGTFAGVGFGPHLNDGGDVAFAGVVSTDLGPGGEFGLGVGLFAADPNNNLRAIARPGDVAPGGETFDWAAYSWTNRRGDIAFMGHVVEQGQSPLPEVDIFAPSAGIYRYLANWGRIELVARPGDPSPDGGEFTFTFFPRLNNDELVFAAQTSAHPDVFGVFVESAGAISALVVPGDSLPGGGHFVSLGVGSTTSNPISVNDRGDVEFLATLDTDDNHDGRADTGVFQWSHGSLSVVARTGTVMPGLGTVRLVRQQDMASNDRGQVVFWARLTDRREVMILATPAGERVLLTPPLSVRGAESSDHSATVAPPPLSVSPGAAWFDGPESVLPRDNMRPATDVETDAGDRGTHSPSAPLRSLDLEADRESSSGVKLLTVDLGEGVDANITDDVDAF